MCPPKDMKKSSHIWAWQGGGGKLRWEHQVQEFKDTTVKQNKTPLRRSWEMVQKLRELDGFPEDPRLIPSTYKVAYNCNSSSRGSDVLFCHPQAPGM